METKKKKEKQQIFDKSPRQVASKAAHIRALGGIEDIVLIQRYSFYC